MGSGSCEPAAEPGLVLDHLRPPAPVVLGRLLARSSARCFDVRLQLVPRSDRRNEEDAPSQGREDPFRPKPRGVKGKVSAACRSETPERPARASTDVLHVGGAPAASREGSRHAPEATPTTRDGDGRPVADGFPRVAPQPWSPSDQEHPLRASNFSAVNASAVRDQDASMGMSRYHFRFDVSGGVGERGVVTVHAEPGCVLWRGWVDIPARVTELAVTLPPQDVACPEEEKTMTHAFPSARTLAAAAAAVAVFALAAAVLARRRARSATRLVPAHRRSCQAEAEATPPADCRAALPPKRSAGRAVAMTAARAQAIADLAADVLGREVGATPSPPGNLTGSGAPADDDGAGDPSRTTMTRAAWDIVDRRPAAPDGAPTLHDWSISVAVPPPGHHGYHDDDDDDDRDLLRAFLAAPPRSVHLGGGPLDRPPQMFSSFSSSDDDADDATTDTDDRDDWVKRTIRGGDDEACDWAAANGNDAGWEMAEDDDRLLCDEKAFALRRERRPSVPSASPFAFRMWGSGILVADARRLLGDLSTCAPFGSATLRLFGADALDHRTGLPAERPPTNGSAPEGIAVPAEPPALSSVGDVRTQPRHTAASVAKGLGHLVSLAAAAATSAQAVVPAVDAAGRRDRRSLAAAFADAAEVPGSRHVASPRVVDSATWHHPRGSTRLGGGRTPSLSPAPRDGSGRGPTNRRRFENGERESWWSRAGGTGRLVRGESPRTVDG